MLPQEYLKIIKTTGRDQLSFLDITVDRMLGETDGQHLKLLIEVITRGLNAKLSIVKQKIEELAPRIIEEEIGHPEDWVEFNTSTLVRQMTERVSSQILYGKELAENQSFIRKIRYHYLYFLLSASAQRLMYLGPFRALFKYITYLPMHRLQRSMGAQLLEVIEQRSASQATGNDVPQDCLQWLAEHNASSKDEKNMARIAQMLSFLSEPAIGTISRSFLETLYDCLAYPEYQALIREETQTCLERFGGWTDEAFLKMEKLESFLQESFRTNTGTVQISPWRVVTAKKFRFDTSLEFRQGTVIAFPIKSILRDEDNYKDAGQFDGLRHYRKSQKQRLPGEDRSFGNEHDSLAFGYGRQSCPGRFYVLRVFKSLISRLLYDYDIRLVDEADKKPSGTELEVLLMPNTKARIKIRSRKHKSFSLGEKPSVEAKGFLVNSSA
ncbi:MAG: hypothetical protein M1814_000168 [Vezdaea aestivalis]|nr:MAG: hypothetical protein M1814_000168 [Vezdaea aestivalis]